MIPGGIKATFIIKFVKVDLYPIDVGSGVQKNALRHKELMSEWIEKAPVLAFECM
jgi:hypothetical protein